MKLNPVIMKFFCDTQTERQLYYLLFRESILKGICAPWDIEYDDEGFAFSLMVYCHSEGRAREIVGYIEHSVDMLKIEVPYSVEYRLFYMTPEEIRAQDEAFAAESVDRIPF
jgi:hypothetical protein